MASGAAVYRDCNALGTPGAWMIDNPLGASERRPRWQQSQTFLYVASSPHRAIYALSLWQTVRLYPVCVARYLRFAVRCAPARMLHLYHLYIPPVPRMPSS